METCPLAQQLWKKVEKCNQQAIQRQEDITEIIRNWPQQRYKSMILNSLWRLIPEFVYWTLWKERNHRIFKNSIRSIEDLWFILHKIFQESLGLKAWQDSDMPKSQQEPLILTKWNLYLKAISKAAVNPSKRSTSPTSWSPPAHNTYKLNFDGAAKGNLGLAGYGGVIRSRLAK